MKRIIEASRRIWLACMLIVLFLSSSLSLAEDFVVVGGESSAPYYFEQDGDVIGSDAEIVKFILDRLGVKYQLKAMSGARLRKSLENGSVDIAASLVKTADIEAIASYLDTPARNAEYVLLTNNKTKERFNATNLQYVKQNGLKVGITSSEPYNENFWALYPKKDDDGFNDDLDVATHVQNNLLKLSRDRINVFPSERLSGQYLARSLGLNNITSYDFILFFKPLFYAFSQQSNFSDSNYSSIDGLLDDFQQSLASLQETPEYFRLTNVDVDTDYSGEDLGSLEIVEDVTQGPTVNVGFLAALSGPDSGWGKPGLTGNQLFIDRVNAKGGLLVGGVRYPLRMHTFDDEGDGEKALIGARQLVEQHDVKFISAIGGAAADATHPYLTNKKVIYASLIATDIKPDRPYLLAGGDVTPRIDMLRPWYHKNKNPSLTRWAVVSQGDPVGRACQAWEVGSAIAEGWEVVYDKHFDTDTSNFSGIVRDILQTNPDVISLNLTLA